MQSWQMQNAKARFSELVKQAAQEGPQDITLHGKSVAVVVSRELFDRLSGNEQSLVDFMRASPLAKQYSRVGLGEAVPSIEIFQIRAPSRTPTSDATRADPLASSQIARNTPGSTRYCSWPPSLSARMPSTKSS